MMVHTGRAPDHSPSPMHVRTLSPSILKPVSHVYSTLAPYVKLSPFTVALSTRGGRSQMIS